MVEYYDKDGQHNMQYNVIFSQQFGFTDEYKTQEEFLDAQYFVVQQYNEEHKCSNYGIFKMDSMYDPIYTELMNDPPDYLDDLPEDMINIQASEDKDEALNEQIIFVNHQFIENSKDGSTLLTHFVLVT